MTNLTAMVKKGLQFLLSLKGRIARITHGYAVIHLMNCFPGGLYFIIISTVKHRKQFPFHFKAIVMLARSYTGG